MMLYLKTMRRTVTSGKPLDVLATSDGATTPFLFSFVALREMMACVALFSGIWKRLKVFNDIMRMIVVFVMNVKALWDRAVVLLPKPDVVRFAVSVFKAFAFGCFQCGKGITGKLPSLIVKRAPSTGVVFIQATIN